MTDAPFRPEALGPAHGLSDGFGTRFLDARGLHFVEDTVLAQESVEIGAPVLIVKAFR